MLLIIDHKFNIPHYYPAPHFGTFGQAFLKEIENYRKTIEHKHDFLNNFQFLSKMPD